MSRHFSPVDITSIIEIILWSPTLVVAAFFIFRYGLRPFNAWAAVGGPIFILSALRLAKAGLQLSDPSLYIPVFGSSAIENVCLGFLPLILVGLLFRANAKVVKYVLRGRIGCYGLFSLAVIGIILAATAGGLFGSLNTRQFWAGYEMARAMTIYFTIASLLTLGAGAYSLCGTASTTSERRVLFSLLATTPFVIIRHAFSIRIWWDTRTVLGIRILRIFSESTYDTWLYFGTGMLTDLIVVGIALGCGFWIGKTINLETNGHGTSEGEDKQPRPSA